MNRISSSSRRKWSAWLAFIARFTRSLLSLSYEQAQAKREEVQRTQEVVAQLETSNRNLRRAETSLRRSERLAALGQLTAGLAHELRNPLGTIKASSEMLMKDTAKNNPEVMAEMASFIRSEADRMNSLIGSFLTFARPLQIHAVIADLRSVMADVLREQSERARSCSVELRFEAGARMTCDSRSIRIHCESRYRISFRTRFRRANRGKASKSVPRMLGEKDTRFG